MQFIPSEIWKWHALLFGIHAESANIKISECFGVNLRTNSYSYWWKNKHLTHIIVFGVVTNDGDIILPFIFLLNTEAYIKLPAGCSAILDWKGSCWNSQCLTNKGTQSWLSENFCDHISTNICPPNSPDCNHLGYVWNVIGWETKKNLCNIKDELKARIKAAFTNLNKVTLGKVCRRFPSHLEAVVKASTNFFE